MAWWIKKDSYYGPYFNWINPDTVTEKRGLVASGLSLSRPLSEENVTTCPYHTGQNVTNDLKAGIKVADELLQLTGRLPLPRKDAPGRIPPAKK